MKLDLKRRWKWFWQRRKWGFDERELWSLDDTIAKFVLPRLKVFRNNTGGYPGVFSGDPKGQEKWEAIIDQMIFGLNYVASGDCYKFLDDKTHKKAQKGLRLFGEWFMDLWN